MLIKCQSNPGERFLNINKSYLIKFMVLCALAGLSVNAEAYLDPGTGSMMLQVILGGIAAIGVVLKLYWFKLRAFLGFGKKEKAEDKAV